MVSIVVPVYNVEKYLRQCVDSILSQSYKDFEIILVDDGSTDNSGTICDEYAENPVIRVFHKQNEGLGMARNTGIDAAKGDYVAFLDSDDYWYSDALEKLMSAIEQNGADTCIGGYTRVNNEGEVLLAERPQNEVFRDGRAKDEFFPRLMGSLPDKKDSFRPSVWNSVYSLKLIREHNVRFPSEREYIAEDIVFDTDYYRRSQCVCTIDSASYCYRVTPGSLTQSYKPDRFDKVVYLYKELFGRLPAYGYTDDCVLRANRQFFVYLRSCISQEDTQRSKKSKRDALKSIRQICGNEFTRQCISGYPVSKMGFPQRVFLRLVKMKSARLLYMLVAGRKSKGGKA